MSDFDKIRKALTSWPAIIIGFAFAGWPGFLLLLWKIVHEASEDKSGNMSDTLKKSVFGAESVAKDVYWDRNTQRWVRVGEQSDAQQAEEGSGNREGDYNPDYNYSYTYKDGQPVATNAPASQETPAKQDAPKQQSKRAPKKAKAAAQSKKASRFPKIKDGKAFVVAGAIMTLIFAIGSVSQFSNALYYESLVGSESLWSALHHTLVPLMFTAIGAGMLLWGRFKNKQARQFRKLLNVIGDATVISVRTLSDATGCAYHKVCDMLQTMIDAGYLGYRAYLNMSTGELVMDGSAVRTAPAAEPPKEGEELTVEEDKGLLSQIRAANDAIADEEMSRKISRIEEITGHILDYQDNHPEKAAELRKFLSYYLPTTLKILNTYAELERQRVSGDNINATKQRIEGMMDKVVEGFELQLDKLFENDMLDITSDIAVMESMLSQDGLSSSEQLKMPKAPEPAEAARQQSAAANTAYTTPDGIRLTLDPQNDAGSAGAQAARKA